MFWIFRMWTEEESDADVSDVQGQDDLGEVEDVEDVFTSGEEPSDPDTGDASFELTDGNTEEYVQDDLLLAASSAEKYQDGTYTPESFTFQGGSGKVTINLPEGDHYKRKSNCNSGFFQQQL